MKTKDKMCNLMIKAMEIKKDWHIKLELTSKIKILMENQNSKIYLILKIFTQKL